MKPSRMLFSFKHRKKEEEKDKKPEAKKKGSKMDELTDDLDFVSETPVRKADSSTTKQDISFVSLISDIETDLAELSVPLNLPHTRKTAGWAEDTPGKKRWLRRSSKQFKESPKHEVADFPAITSKLITSKLTIKSIPAIPDLDDTKDEDFSADAAKAPSLAVSRIATYQELDNDLSKHSAFQSLDGIDLTLLTKRLLPENVVKKEDEVPWTWDTLFADVSSQVNAVMSEDLNDMSVSDKVGDSIEKM